MPYLPLPKDLWSFDGIILYDNQPISPWAISNEIGLLPTLLYLYRDMQCHTLLKTFTMKAIHRLDWFLALEGKAYGAAKTEARQAIKHAEGVGFDCNPVFVAASISKAVYLARKAALITALGEQEAHWPDFEESVRSDEDHKLARLLFDVLRDNRMA